MKDEKHEFQISGAELAYLSELASERQWVSELFKKCDSANGNKFIVWADRVEAERLRDYLTEQLAVVGFDENYSLTQQGQMLEDLIDRFYDRGSQ